MLTAPCHQGPSGHHGAQTPGASLQLNNKVCAAAINSCTDAKLFISEPPKRYPIDTGWGPSSLAKLVNITIITIVYDTYKYMVDVPFSIVMFDYRRQSILKIKNNDK